MQSREPSQLLRNTLRANAAFSMLSGAMLVVACAALAKSFAISDSRILLAIGLGLLPFGLRLFQNASKPQIDMTEAKLAVVLDVAWVLGSAAVLAAGVLSSTGNWAVAIVADLVLVFAVAQTIGLRRIQAAAPN